MNAVKLFSIKNHAEGVYIIRSLSAVYHQCEALYIIKPAAWIKKFRKHLLSEFFGADYGDRTRHLNLGKVALYQMS